jgi:hypothetical protein
MSIFSASKAQGTWTVTSTGSTAAGYIVDAQNVVVGNRTYRFATTTSAAYDIFLATSAASLGTTNAIASLIKAVNGTGTVAASGADCFTGTLRHEYVKAAASGTRAVIFTSMVPGTIGNLVTFTTTATCAACDAATLGTTTAATGSASVDLDTWADSLLDHQQLNSQTLRSMHELVGELAI